MPYRRSKRAKTNPIEENQTTTTTTTKTEEDDIEVLESSPPKEQIGKIEETKPKESENKNEDKKQEAIELQCGICFEKVKMRGILNSCDHPYCFSCILKWSKESNTCPFCKVRFTSLTKVDACNPNKKDKKPKKVRVTHKDQKPDYNYFVYSEDSDEDEDEDEGGGFHTIEDIFFRFVAAPYMLFNDYVPLIEIEDSDEESGVEEIEILDLTQEEPTTSRTTVNRKRSRRTNSRLPPINTRRSVNSKRDTGSQP